MASYDSAAATADARAAPHGWARSAVAAVLRRACALNAAQRPSLDALRTALEQLHRQVVARTPLDVAGSGGGATAATAAAAVATVPRSYEPQPLSVEERLTDIVRQLEDLKTLILSREQGV